MRTWSDARSTLLYTATDRICISRRVRAMRTAISPRLAMRTFSNIRRRKLALLARLRASGNISLPAVCAAFVGDLRSDRVYPAFHMGFWVVAPRWMLLALLLAVSGCKSGSSQHTERVQLRKLDGELIELLPLAALPANCLVFSVSQSGVVRELTKNAERTSIECAPGRAI